MNQKITHDIEVAVQSFYLDNESDPEKPLFLFAYRVRIENHGYETVQLLKRHWIITDGDGQVRHVEGEGVVGEQPVLKPGESFEYTSGCPLSTPVGTMRGRTDQPVATMNATLMKYGSATRGGPTVRPTRPRAYK